MIRKLTKENKWKKTNVTGSSDSFQCASKIHEIDKKERTDRSLTYVHEVDDERTDYSRREKSD